MKKIISLTLALTLLFNVGFAQNLRNGQNVSIRLTNEIKTKNKLQSDVMAIVDKDVVDPLTNTILISRGAPVEINSTIKRAKGVGNPAEIKLQCLSTQAVDGKRISLQGAYSATGDDNKGLALGLGIGLGIFIWPAIFCLCIKGGNIEIPSDMMIHNVVVNDNYVVVVQ